MGHPGLALLWLVSGSRRRNDHKGERHRWGKSKDRQVGEMRKTREKERKKERREKEREEEEKAAMQKQQHMSARVPSRKAWRKTRIALRSYKEGCGEQDVYAAHSSRLASSLCMHASVFGVASVFKNAVLFSTRKRASSSCLFLRDASCARACKYDCERTHEEKERRAPNEEADEAIDQELDIR